MESEEQRCFICNGIVNGTSWAVSSCRLQTSRKKLVGVLGKLLGDRFVVVCNEDDIICHDCVSLFNRYDNYDLESVTLRSKIVRLLEKKLCLEEGSFDANAKETKSSSSSTFEELKREAEEEMEVLEDLQDARSRVWLQCDKCSYTTNYTSFVRRHVDSDFCGQCRATMKNGRCTASCNHRRDVPNETIPEASESSPQTITLFNGDTSDQAYVVSEDNPIEINLDDALTFSGEEEISTPNKKAVYLQVVDGGSHEMRKVTVTEAATVDGMQIFWEDDIEETSAFVSE